MAGGHVARYQGCRRDRVCHGALAARRRMSIFKFRTMLKNELLKAPR
jgi:hypothetical protein